MNSMTLATQDCLSRASVTSMAHARPSLGLVALKMEESSIHYSIASTFLALKTIESTLPVDLIASMARDCLSRQSHSILQLYPHNDYALRSQAQASPGEGGAHQMQPFVAFLVALPICCVQSFVPELRCASNSVAVSLRVSLAGSTISSVSRSSTPSASDFFTALSFSFFAASSLAFSFFLACLVL